MAAATHNDVLRLVPGIQDHAIVEILAAAATVSELEAALAALAGDDESLIEIEQRQGDRIHRLMSILRASQIEPDENREP